jgi:hypothetical protein
MMSGVAGLQKVSAQLELSKSAPQTVVNDQQQAVAMKYWEIIADNLSKADGVGAVSQRSIPAGKQCLLQMRTATTESISLCVQMSSRIARNS